MPLPKPSPETPKTHKSMQKFVSKCVGDPRAVKEFPDQKQRLAYCYTTWRRTKSKADVVVSAAGDEYIYGPDLTDEEVTKIKAEYYRPFDKSEAPSIYGPEGPKTK